mmetsp:Transcript_125571/g.250519  ORF Transcript_125571/g.250519 Transcript_125571/m.250519 type:complete len:429 (+) Transcript_125571:99-1385(+)
MLALGLGPWVPFMAACFGRALGALSLLLLVEGQVLGFAPGFLRNFALYGTAVYVGISVIRQLIASFFVGPTPDLSIATEVGSFRSETVLWAACSMRGWRDAMEDEHIAEMLPSSVFPDAALFAVLDGHGGKEVSSLASRLLIKQVQRCALQRLASNSASGDATTGDSGGGNGCAAASSHLLAESLEEALPRLDAQLRVGSWGLGKLLPGPLHPFAACGSTACVAAVDFRTREVVVANVGDSRTLLIRNGKALALSEDHKPENPKERNRIQAAGGRVLKMGPCHRVDGTLNLSRALGDFHLKSNSALPPESQKVVAVPDATRTKFLGGPQELLVVACDGLFERCSNQDVADIIWPRLKRGLPLEQIGQELLHACCARSCRGRPIEQGTDNETVILVQLPPTEVETSPSEGCPKQRNTVQKNSDSEDTTR